MATILSVSSSDVLKTTRQLLLEQQGYVVCSAQTLAEVESIGKTKKADLAVIGHGFPGPEKRKIAHAVNHYYPGLPILEMCFQSPEIPGADFVLSDSPDELITAIKLVLGGRRVRGYTE
jgi:DNA-binding response OmpR family regulator